MQKCILLSIIVVIVIEIFKGMIKLDNLILIVKKHKTISRHCIKEAL